MHPFLPPPLPWWLGETELLFNLLPCEEVLHPYTLSYFLNPGCYFLECHFIIRNDHLWSHLLGHESQKLPLKFLSWLCSGQLQMYSPGCRACEHQYISFLFLLLCTSIALKNVHLLEGVTDLLAMWLLLVLPMASHANTFHTLYCCISFLSRVWSCSIHHSSCNAAVVLAMPKCFTWIKTCWISFCTNCPSSR